MKKPVGFRNAEWIFIVTFASGTLLLALGAELEILWYTHSGLILMLLAIIFAILSRIEWK
ncbi:MAG: hypothetical protein ACE5J9_06570 [Methanosarcinales archaeon]